MAQIEVKLIDQSGKEVRLALPDDRPIDQLVSAILNKLQIPDPDPETRYILRHKVTGNELDPEKTLAEENVQNGDIVCLRMEAVAGAGST